MRCDVMFVQRWMTPDPITIPPHMTISAAALEMGRHKFRHLLIAESSPAGKKLLGLLSKYDIARAFPDHTNPFSAEVTESSVADPVSKIMVRDVVVVEPNSAIEEAAQLLRTRGINALPVVRSGTLVGIITESDVFAAMIAMTSASSFGGKMIVESADVKTALHAVTELSRQQNLEILNVVSFQEKAPRNRVLSSFYFSGRPSVEFSQQLCRLGMRVLKID